MAVYNQLSIVRGCSLANYDAEQYFKEFNMVHAAPQMLSALKAAQFALMHCTNNLDKTKTYNEVETAINTTERGVQ